MSNYSWITIEDAVVGALRAQLGTQVKTLETYQGDWPADLKQKDWRFPALLVMLQQTRGEQITLSSYDLTMDLTVMVVVRHLRGEAAGRRDEDGAYHILGVVRQALWNRDLGLEIQPFSLVKEEPLLNTQEFTVYAAHYSTVMVQDL